MLKKIFLRGLLTITPLAITGVIIVWLFTFIESLFSKVIIDLLGPRYYFPGLGILVALILIFFVGMMMSNWVTKQVYSLLEKWLQKMPLIKTLYASIVDLMSFFKSDKDLRQGPIVMVHFNETRVLGLVSREHFEDLPAGIGKEGDIAVYIPMSYQIGGVTVIVPKSKVERVDMKIEEGLRFAATAGMPGKQTEKRIK